MEALGIGSAADLSLLVLAEIRQVVEVAVSTALARLEGSMVTSAQRQVNEDAEAEMLLDDLGGALQLKE